MNEGTKKQFRSGAWFGRTVKDGCIPTEATRQLYIRHVMQAWEAADQDFPDGGRGMPETRISH
jgi:hypothetical protein